MRRYAIFTVVASLLLAAPVAGCGKGEKTRRVVVIAGEITETHTELGRPGWSVGELRAFTRPLTTEAGKPIGQLDGTSVITHRRGSGSQVVQNQMGTVQLTLREGTLVAAGVFVPHPSGSNPHPRGVRRPIVGGTGSYWGARGQIVQTPLPGGKAKYVAEFQTPDR